MKARHLGLFKDRLDVEVGPPAGKPLQFTLIIEKPPLPAGGVPNP